MADATLVGVYVNLALHGFTCLLMAWKWMDFAILKSTCCGGWCEFEHEVKIKDEDVAK